MRIPVTIKEMTEKLRLAVKVLNGNVSFGTLQGNLFTLPNMVAVPADNLDGCFIPVRNVTPNVPTVLTHNLGRVPTGYIIVSQLDDQIPPQTKNAVYSTTGDLAQWSTTQITLRFMTNIWSMLYIF